MTHAQKFAISLKARGLKDCNNSESSISIDEFSLVNELFIQELSAETEADVGRAKAGEAEKYVLASHFQWIDAVYFCHWPV